jgi:phage terminase small subunit
MPISAKRPSLNAKYSTFVREYVRTRSAIKAYRSAGFGYEGQGQSAYSCASEILNRPEIQQAINQMLAELDKKAIAEMANEWKKTRKVRRDIAYASLDDVLDPESDGLPKLKSWKEIPKRTRRAMKKIKLHVNKDGGTEAIEVEMKDPSPHLAAIEDKFSILPDNQRPPLKIDLAIDGIDTNTVDGRRKALLEIMAAIKARVAAKTVIPLNGIVVAANGSALSSGHAGANGDECGRE